MNIIDANNVKLINSGKICPYCSNSTEYIDSVEIYGKSYGMIYICRPCDSWVGVHNKKSKKALGRLANRDLRNLKKQAHAYLDPLWKKKIFQKVKQEMLHMIGYLSNLI